MTKIFTVNSFFCLYALRLDSYKNYSINAEEGQLTAEIACSLFISLNKHKQHLNCACPIMFPKRSSTKHSLCNRKRICVLH